jgi:SAM-dependent methyltransferase
MSTSHDTGWDGIYHRYPLRRLPWELGRPREVLKDLVESETVKPCETLDLCCGAGTNPVYLAKNGFNVTALDISDRAVELAMDKAGYSKVGIDFLIGDFASLPFKEARFELVFDFGCFHHVEPEYRTIFIDGVYRALDIGGTYLMVCFSDRNGSAENHFTKEKLIELFGHRFEIRRMNHVSSVEADGVTRYFYEVLMRRPELGYGS